MEFQKPNPHAKPSQPSPVSAREKQGRLMRFVRAHKADIAFIAYCAVVGTAGALIVDNLHDENTKKFREYEQTRPHQIEQIAPKKPRAMA